MSPHLSFESEDIFKLKEEMSKMSERLSEYESMRDPLSFERWTSGIGKSKLSNDGFSETCTFSKVDGLRLSEEAVTHRDPLYKNVHRCNDDKKWSELIEVSKSERFIVLKRIKCKGGKMKKLWQYQSESILRGNLEKINSENLWAEIESAESGNDSLIRFKLERLTQSVWLKQCETAFNHFVSLLPLKIKNA